MWEIKANSMYFLCSITCTSKFIFWNNQQPRI